MHPIPLSEVKALRRATPPLPGLLGGLRGLGGGLGGLPCLVVVLASGLTLPPLYFTKGGIKALISTLKQVGARARACVC